VLDQSEPASPRRRHNVFTPTLTGLGERSHLLTRTDYSQRPFPPITEDSWHDRASDPQEFGVTDAGDVAWMKARLTDMPRKCMRQPLQLAGDKGRRIEKAYIRCSTRPFAAEAADRAKRRGYRYRELLSAGHDAMMTRPRELAKLLIELV